MKNIFTWIMAILLVGLIVCGIAGCITGLLNLILLSTEIKTITFKTGLFITALIIFLNQIFGSKE